MFPNKVSAVRALGFVFVFAFSIPGWPEQAARSADVSDLASFSRSVLLRRFDTDADGQLSVAEKKELRSAFGELDVPMLPRPSYRYARLKLPAQYGEAKMRAMDNTPANNRLSDAGSTLGRVLFYDRRLSANNTISCASCHLQQNAFSDPRQFSFGFDGGRTSRNAMGLANVRFTVLKGSRPGFFWDERAATLEEQVLMPIQDKIEMGMTLGELELKLRKLPYYAPLCEAAFGTPTITSNHIAKAVAQFMRSMVSFNSKFDRAVKEAEGDLSRSFDRFNVEENLGKSLFINGVGGVAEIGCAHCHMPPTFGMPKSFNNGLDKHYKDRGLGARELPPNDPFTADNNGKFKAPPLRNVALTSPYMHDGRFKTLEQVVEHYSSGVQLHANLGLAFSDSVADGRRARAGFGLTPVQKSALVAFMKTLTDEQFVSDPKFSDPFIRIND